MKNITLKIFAGVFILYLLLQYFLPYIKGSEYFGYELIWLNFLFVIAIVYITVFIIFLTKKLIDNMDIILLISIAVLFVFPILASVIMMQKAPDTNFNYPNLNSTK